MFEPRRSLSQNFLHSRQLVKQLVRQTCIGKNDTVIEVGPGRGIITQELAKVAQTVLAIEQDQRLIPQLVATTPPSVNIFHQNGLTFPLPASQYKVFSNPPFAIEGKLLRKFLRAEFPPRALYLVVRHKPAKRWTGTNKNTRFAMMYQPWFEFSITHHFQPHDFKHQTKVQPVLLTATWRSTPLIPWSQRQTYWQFVKTGFSNGRNLNRTLIDNYYTKQQLIVATSQLGFSYKSHPTQLGVEDWVALWMGVKSS